MNSQVPKRLSKILVSLYRIFSLLLFDIRLLISRWRGIPYFIRTIFEYRQQQTSKSSFNITIRSLQPVLHERFEEAGTARGHYFWQDLWAFEYLQAKTISKIVDVGSRIDGYIAHLLPTTEVTYIDVRKIPKFHPNFFPRKGSILDLPFADRSVRNVSCLHVIEHIGLGRYGDDVDPHGHVKGIGELKRITAPGGRVIIGVPVGVERLAFNAHRIFKPQTVIDYFKPFKLEEFSLIDDRGDCVIKNASLDIAATCDYGCGLFVFVNDEL